MADPIKQTASDAAPALAAAEYTLTDALKQETTKTREGIRQIFKDTRTQGVVEQAVLGLCQQLMERGELVSDNALELLNSAIAELDDKLSQQVNLILHHPDFQALEGTWRGLEHLVYGTITGPDLKIRVLNITKDEIRAVFKQHKGTAWDQSPLFKMIYGPYDMPGGEPFGTLIGDYSFNHRAPDLEVLKGMAQIAAAAHAPFIAGADPSLMGMDSWLELNDPRKLADIFDAKANPEYAGWTSFRASDDAKYAALAMPRFLARLPYGKDNEVSGFSFKETHEGGTHANYTWANAAFAMGANITQSFKTYGWCSKIWGKGADVSGLNCHTFPTDDGRVDMKCPTEVSIGDRRDKEMEGVGIVDLRHWQNTDTAAFGNAVNLYQPKEYDDTDATANSELNAQLPCIFATSRFAHFIKVMVREALGQFTTRENMESWLNKWITNYVCRDASASEETKAKLPLAAAEVEVTEVAGKPGYYDATFWLLPHFQLRGVRTSIRLVSKLPSVKKQ